MGFLTKEGLQNLTNKLVQGDAIKVASHRGKNVKEVIDNIQRECENVALPNTMTLENRISEFKVGKGRDVDVSGDVEEGKVEVELQGKTWQNLTGFGASFQARHPSVFEKIDDEDSLLVKRISSDDSGWVYWCNDKLKRTLIKPDTKYTLLFKFDSNKNYNLQVGLRDGSSANLICNSISATRVFSNIYMAKLTTVSNFDGLGNAQVIYFHSGIPSKKGDWSRYYKDMILLEGDYTQTPIEELPKYFEGIKSSFEDGVVDVEVTGKNLWSYENQLTFDVVSIPSIGLEQGVYKITSSNITGQKHNDSPYINFVDSKGDTISATSLEKGTVMINRDVDKIVLYSNGFDYVNSVGKFVTFGNFQLEKVPNKTFNPTPYEPYYKKKISFNIGEPLRSLPSGVCDEITDDGRLIRRVGKVVFNGSENWSYPAGEIQGEVFACFRALKTPRNNVHCDTLPSFDYAKYTDLQCIMTSNSSVIISVLNKNLNTVDINGFRQWLSENPTTVYYELKTPIITSIEPMEFDVKPLATMTINSEIAPISNHKVILNRAGQIEQGIELIANLRNRVNTLESIYDSNLIATQYKLDNLKLNYELEREED